MPSSNLSAIRPADVLQTVLSKPGRVIVPTLVLAVVAVVYVLVRPATWEASQALIVRDEAGASPLRPGKFGHADDMKTTQETLLELARSRAVLTRALVEAGPPSDFTGQNWPTDKHVEALQGTLKLCPPKGAEFGKTEMFYLRVQASSPERAVRLASAICRQLQERFENLRAAKSLSVIHEVEKSVSLAKRDLHDSTTALTDIEQRVGRDLAELRILNESPSGDSDLRRMATELESELRVQKAALQSNQELLQVLTAAKVEIWGRLLASPNRLLESQPAIRRLKDGLVDAQLRTAQLLGRMSPAHPEVQAATAAEKEVSEHLHNELAIGIKGVEIDLRLTQQRVDALLEQRSGIHTRMNRLAGLRAEYSNLATAVRNRSEILKTAEQELAGARASQAGAHTASLISLVDLPDPGSRPLGPGRTSTVLGGGALGLLVGLAWVFLTIQPSQTVGHNGSTNGHIGNGNGVATTHNGGRPVKLSIKQALEKLLERRGAYN